MRTENFILSEKRYENIVNQLKGIQTLLANQEILQKNILDFEQACLYLRVSDSFLYKKTANNEIPFRKPSNRKLYFLKSELDEWLTRDKPQTAEQLESEAQSIIQELFNPEPLES